MKTKIDTDKVEKALASLESQLGEDVVSKASEDDLDQPEGADMGNPAKDKMSDAAKAKKAMAKAKACKADDEDMDMDKADDEDEDDMDKGFDEMMADKKKAYQKAKKSFADEMPEEIETKIDVSEFLKSLVDHTGKSINALTQYVAKSDAAHDVRYSEVLGIVEDVQKSQAKIGIVLKAICQQIGIVSAAPAQVRKSETVAKSQAAAPAREFSSGLEGEQSEKVFKSLSENPTIAKSQISNALCDLVKKGEAQDMDVIGFETNSYIRPELVSKLKTVLN